MASFSIVDYTIFALVLLISAFIGLFFGFCRKKSNTSDEVLLGNRKMGVRNKFSIILNNLNEKIYFNFQNLKGYSNFSKSIG